MYFFAGMECDNRIIFSARDTNGLFSYEDKKLKFVNIFEKENMCTMLHRKAFYSNGGIWFLPWEGEYIARVDESSYNIDYFNIVGLEHSKKKLLYDYCILDESSIIAVTKDGMITKIDAKRREAFVLADLSSYFCDCQAIGVLVIEGWIYLISSLGKIIKAYNLEVDEVKVEIVCMPQNKSYNFLSMIDSKDKVWLVPDDNREIVCYYKRKNYMEIITIGDDNAKSVGYFHGFSLKEEVVILPAGDNEKLLRIKEGAVFIDDCVEKMNLKFKSWKEACGIQSKNVNTGLIVLNCGVLVKLTKDNCVVIGSIEEPDWSQRSLFIDKSRKSNMMQHFFSDIVIEGKFPFNLKDFLYYLAGEK